MKNALLFWMFLMIAWTLPARGQDTATMKLSIRKVDSTCNCEYWLKPRSSSNKIISSPSPTCSYLMMFGFNINGTYTGGTAILTFPSADSVTVSCEGMTSTCTISYDKKKRRFFIWQEQTFVMTCQQNILQGEVLFAYKGKKIGYWQTKIL